MFSGGSDDTQVSQDNVAAVDPAAPTDNGTGVTDTSQSTDTSSSVTLPEPAGLPVFTPPASAPPTPAADSSGLLSIKQQALQQLSSMVGQLDQPPDERFRTIMMMVQASDNSSLLSAAYDAAQQITDEKARAQALLDVVNEINYFTQQHERESEPVAA